MKWCLEAVADSDKVWQVTIESVPFVIGRADDCNLKLNRFGAGVSLWKACTYQCVENQFFRRSQSQYANPIVYRYRCHLSHSGNYLKGKCICKNVSIKCYVCWL